MIRIYIRQLLIRLHLLAPTLPDTIDRLALFRRFKK